MFTVEFLKKVLDNVRLDEDVQPRDGLTYCNIATNRILKFLDIPMMINPLTGQAHLANSMVDTLVNSPTKWQQINGMSAFEYVTDGHLVLAAQKNDMGHGHIAAVYPTEKMGYSPSWGKDVPYINNIGKRNDILRASQCFRTEPMYFSWIG